MSGPFPLLSSVGATGATQNPGVFGQIGQGLTGLAGILQASQDHMLRQQQLALQSDYQKGQLDHMRAIEQQNADAAQAAAQQQSFIGQGIQALQPRQTSITPPGGAPFQMEVPGASVEQVIGALPPQVVPEFMKQGEPAIKASQGRQAEAQARTKLTSTLKALSPTAAKAVGVLSDLPKDLPAEVRTQLYNELTSTVQGIKPEQLNAFVSATKAGLGPTEAAGLLGFQLPPGMENFRPKDEGDWMQRLVTTLTLQNQMGNLTEGENRITFLYKGAQRELGRMEGILKTYNPASEPFFATLLPGQARRAVNTDEGKQFLDAVEQIAMARAYAQSGANVPFSEVQTAARASIQQLFDSKANIKVKIDRVRSWVDDLKTATGRGAGRLEAPIANPYARQP